MRFDPISRHYTLANKVFEIVQSIPELVACRADDLHSYAFNKELFFDPASFRDEEKAETALNRYGVFKCIRLVQEYEKHLFGEVFTPVEPAEIANMVISVMGDFLLNRCDYLDGLQYQNRKMSEQEMRNVAAKVMRDMRSFEDDYALFDSVCEHWL